MTDGVRTTIRRTHYFVPWVLAALNHVCSVELIEKNKLNVSEFQIYPEADGSHKRTSSGNGW